MAIQQITIGQVVSNDPIPQFKAREVISSVISFVDPKQLFAVSSYFVDTKKTPENKNILGYIHHSDDIVPMLGSPAIHYYGLVIDYPLLGLQVNQGYGLDEKAVSFKYVKFGPANYDKLRTIAGSNKLDQIDISVDVAKGKEKYQELIMSPITSNPAKWKSMPSIVAKAPMYLEMFKKLLPDIVGLEISAGDLTAYMLGNKTAEQIKEELKSNKFNFIADAVSNQPVIAQPMVRSIASPQESVNAQIVEDVDLSSIIQV